jgi:hypothetical protein
MKKLNKFEIPDDLNEVERSVLLLKKSNTIQRVSVLINLPTILTQFPESQDILLPKIFKDVLSWDEELQIEFGASLAVIIEENLLSPEMYEAFHKFILEALESWNNAKWDVICEHYINNLDRIMNDKEKQAVTIDKFASI